MCDGEGPAGGGGAGGVEGGRVGRGGVERVAGGVALLLGGRSNT